jgi:polyketide cyclase/dehydrase/lipid transport protein
MKIVKAIALVLAVAIAGVLLLAATRPTHYRVERSATIAAAPAAVFAQVNDLHRWNEWSPWEKLDPAMKRTYAGPETGPDASYAWAGNDEVGEGRMTIVESVPQERVGIRLEFIKPWTETCQVRFALAPQAAGTRVTWSLQGDHNFVSKVMCVFMDMDKMIGGDFERGLGQLRTVAEAMPAQPEAVASETSGSTPPAPAGAGDK